VAYRPLTVQGPLRPIWAVWLIAVVAACGSPGSVDSGASPNVGPTGVTAVADRYPDGLPKTISEAPVLRGQAAQAFAAEEATETSFLIGGWVTHLGGMQMCPIILPGDDKRWDKDCVRPGFADVAGATDPALSAAVTFRYVLDGLKSGAVVAQVTVHDPRAVECAQARAVCDAMLVAKQIVWRGDDATAPNPLTPDDIAAALVAAQGSTDMAAFGPGSMLKDCGENLPAASVFTVDSAVERTPGAMLVNMEPSLDAMHRALPGLWGAAGALQPNAVSCDTTTNVNGVISHFDHRWLVVRNAALLVRMNEPPTVADRAFLSLLEGLLEAAAAAP
jgi:hypothetical protein